MAITNLSDFTIYNEQFHTGFQERLGQNDAVFNEASNGALRLISGEFEGDYRKDTFFKTLGSGIVTRQDTTSNAAQTATKLQMGENVEVKLWRKFGLTATTFNAFKEIGMDAMKEGSMIIGQNYADAASKEYVNTVIAALRAAIANQATNLYDATGNTVKNISHQNLLKTFRKFGDASSRIRTLIMHSEQWFDLLEQGLTDGFETIATGIIESHWVPALSKNVIVTDSPSLIATADTPDSYYVLGLTDGAATASKFNDVQVEVDKSIVNEQLEMLMAGEYRYSLALKGFAYDAANGGANPNAAAVATGSNWDKVVTNYQDLAGVALKCQVGTF